MHAAELSVAQLTSVYINSQKTKPPYSSPHDFCLFTPQPHHLPSELGDIIYSLRRDNLLPNSAAAWLPWESIPKKSDRLTIKKNLRILRTKGVWAIAPEIEGDFLFIPLAVVEIFGAIRLHDPDTQIVYEVEIEKPPNVLVKDTWWLLKR